MCAQPRLACSVGFDAFDELALEHVRLVLVAFAARLGEVV